MAHDGTHVHCDSDPIECSVEALQGEYEEVKRQRDRYREALEVVLSHPAPTDAEQADAQRGYRPVDSASRTATPIDTPHQETNP